MIAPKNHTSFSSLSTLKQPFWKLKSFQLALCSSLFLHLSGWILFDIKTEKQRSLKLLSVSEVEIDLHSDSHLSLEPLAGSGGALHLSQPITFPSLHPQRDWTVSLLKEGEEELFPAVICLSATDVVFDALEVLSYQPDEVDLQIGKIEKRSLIHLSGDLKDYIFFNNPLLPFQAMSAQDLPAGEFSIEFLVSVERRSGRVFNYKKLSSSSVEKIDKIATEVVKALQFEGIKERMNPSFIAEGRAEVVLIFEEKEEGLGRRMR